MSSQKAENKRPIKIISLSLPRSGTTSLSRALTDLGFHPHHLKFNWFQLERWRYIARAAEAHCPNLPGYTGKPFTTDEWDELLGPYDAVTDLSGALPAAFVEAYPDAKFIFVQRDFEGWFRSYSRTLTEQSFSWQGWVFACILEPLTGSYLHRGLRKLQVGSLGMHQSSMMNRDAMRRYYDERERLIRERVPKDQLLVCSPSDGWEPLCKFLGKDIPPGPYPHRNKSGEFIEAWGWVRMIILLRLAKRLALLAVPLVAIGVTKWFLGWYGRR